MVLPSESTFPLKNKSMTGKMQAVIYSNGNQECERAKTLLEKLDFQLQEYKLNQHFSARGFIEEFGEEAEYPQVNVGFRHIGGLKETLKYMEQEGMLST
jgi:glutaredoxin